MQTDEQLMMEFRSGSTMAFEHLFQRYRNAVYGFFRRRLNDAARAEELAQETFVIILRGADRYEAKAKFRTYIFSVALKQLWSERRRQSRDARVTVDLPPTQTTGEPATVLWIREALGCLDADHREVLMLREYEQLSYDEIAQVLSVPVNTVRSRLSRARAELKTRLDANSTEGVSR